MVKPTEIESLRLSRTKFSRRAARQWARHRGFRTDKMSSTQDHYVFPQVANASLDGWRVRLAAGVSAVLSREENVAVAADGDSHLAAGDKGFHLDSGDMGIMIDSGATDIVLKRGGAVLARDERLSLLQAVRAGEAVEVDLEIVAFQQLTDKPRPLPARMAKHANSRFVTFRQQDLAGFAGSFAGQPFLLEHRRSLESTGGRITSSSLREKGKFSQIVQSITLSRREAVEFALDGTMCEFSIGFASKAVGRAGMRSAMMCTVCDQSFFDGDCAHMPGEIVKVANGGESVIVEAEFREPRGEEVSGVAFPAVQGTKITDINPS